MSSKGGRSGGCVNDPRYLRECRRKMGGPIVPSKNPRRSRHHVEPEPALLLWRYEAAGNSRYPAD